MLLSSNNNKHKDFITYFQEGCLTLAVHCVQFSRFPQASALVPWLQHVQHIGRHNKQSPRRFLFAVLDLTQWCHGTMQCIQLHAWSTPIIRNKQFDKLEINRLIKKYMYAYLIKEFV